MKRLDFSETKRTPRYSLRKLNVGVASVLLGVTIFGINFTNHSVKAATTESKQPSTVVLPTAEQTKGINAIGAVKVPSLTDSQNDANKAIDDALNNKKSEINGATTIDQTTKDKLNQAATDAADKAKEATTNNDVATEQTNTQKATSASNNAIANNSTEATQTSSTKAKQTTQTATKNSDNTKVSSNTTNKENSQPTDKTTNTQVVSNIDKTLASLLTKLLATTYLTDDSASGSSTLQKSDQTVTKVTDPMMEDYKNRGGKNTWIDQTVAPGRIYDFPGDAENAIFGDAGIIKTNPHKYFFAGYADFSEQYHRIILFARGKDASDKNLYTYVVHTYTDKVQPQTETPNETAPEIGYRGVFGIGGSTYNLQVHNYKGESFSVVLKGFKGGYGLTPIFDQGILNPKYKDKTLPELDDTSGINYKEQIGRWDSVIPQETTTSVRYVDLETGKDIAQPLKVTGYGYQGFKINGNAPKIDGYTLVSSPKTLGLSYEDGIIAPYKVGKTYTQYFTDDVYVKQTVIDTNGTVRATAYYKGQPLGASASKILGHDDNNDSMSFTAGGQRYTYNNRIKNVDAAMVYYYQKVGEEGKSQLRVHYIDVTKDTDDSQYAPGDGVPATNPISGNPQTYTGNIGDTYDYATKATAPKGYVLVGTSPNLKGTFSRSDHDAYIYVKIDRNGAKATIEKLPHLNHAQKQAAEAVIDQATDLNTMNQAISTATTLDGDMGKLSDLTADLTNTNNYKYASDKPKSTVAADYTNADVLLDKDDKTAGQNADDATVLKLIDQINTHKSSLDGDTNLSAAKTTISGLTHLNDAQRSAANQAVTNASDLTGLKTAVGNAQSVDSAMSYLQTAVNQANEAKTTNNYLQASADKKDKLNSAVQNAQAVLAATGANDSANQVKALTKSVNDAVNALDGDAINAINAALTDKKAEINGTNLTAEEKTAVINKAQKLADAAIADINKATTNDAVNTAKENGVQAIKNMTIPTVSDVKKNAKDAIDQALNTKKSEINGATNLDQTTKDNLIKEATAAATTAKDAIDKATTNNDVATEQTKGTKAIDEVKVPSLTDSQTAAKQAIDDALNTKKSEINGATNLDQTTKDNLIKEATAAATTAKDAIDKATTNNDVATEQTKGTKAIDEVKVPSLTDSQTAAKQAIDDALNTKKSEINGATNLDQTTKDNLIKEATAAATTAKDAIDKATTNNDVATEQTKGTKAIDEVKVPSLTDSQTAAKQAIDDALNTKKSEINGATNLDQTTKDNLIKEATAAATTAKDAIDKATTNNDVATEQTKGTKAIDEVKVPSLTDSQTAAKQAIDDALNTKKSEINGATNLDQTTKDNLIKEATAAATTAKDAIDKATTNNDVATEQTKGTKAIDEVKVPSLTDSQTAAKQAIDDALNTKKSEINGATNLDQTTKDNLIKEATAAATTAKDAIDKATTNNDVATEQTKGTKAIDEVKVPSLTDSQTAAKQAIDDALNTKKSEINGATNLDQTTKDNLIKEATAAATTAKDAIDKATTNNDVATEQTKGTKAIDEVKVPSLTDSQTAAKQAIDDALNTKKSEINGATNLDQTTKDNLIKEATAAATTAKDAIDKATTNNDVATEQTKGTKAIDEVKVPSLTDSQTAAKQAIDDALNTKKSEINGATNLDQTTKDNLIKEATAAATTAKDAIDKATTNNDVATEQTKGTKAIDEVKVPSLTDSQTAAKQAIDDALNTKKSEINGATNLDQTTKDNLIKEATAAATTAKDAIDKATTNNDVATEQTKGTKAIDEVKVPSLTDSQTAAKQAIDDALNTKKSEINGATNLDQTTKDNLIKEATAAATTAKDAIDKATTNNDVATEQTKGTKAIDEVKVPSLTDSQTAAKQAIDDALNTKKSEINGATNLDQTTKDNLIKEATAAATTAKDAIDKATTNNDVATEQTKGTKAIDEVKVPSLTDSQTAAKQAIDDALNTKKSEINGATNLDQTTKDNLIKEATAAATTAKDAIDKATTNNDVATEQTKGTKAIDEVKVPSLTDSQTAAKQAIDDALNTKKSEINGATNLDQTTKDNLIKEATAAATTAKDAIDKATTNNDVATEQTKGTKAIDEVKVPSLTDSQTAAKQAIDDALNTKKSEINGATNLDQTTKDNLIKEATAAATTAKDAIDKATTNNDVATEQTKGTKAIDEVKVPSLTDSQTAAKQAIDDALNTKKSEINGATNLDQTTKDNLIKEATAAATTAKDAIDKATTNNDVATEQTKGTKAIDEVKVPSLTDSQTAAKQAIDDALNTKKSEINGATNLDQTTKDNLIKEATAAATTAKDAIDKATTNNDVATEQTKGTKAIDEVKVPSLTDSQTAAKQAIDDALNTKKSEINGATNLDQTTKDNLIKEATAAATTAKDAIDKATTNNDVATEQTKGTKAIDEVKVPSLTDSQTAAKQAIDDALNTKKSEINGATNLDQTTKDNLIKEATAAATTAKDAIDKATTNNDVATEQTKGTKAIDEVKVPSLTDSQTAAKQAIDDALNTKKSEINGATNLDQTTKDNLIKEATAAATTAKDAIDKATTNNDVATEQTKGTKAIDEVKVPSLTDSQTAAKQAIDDALNTKKSEINGATNLDQTTKDNLIKEATAAATTAKDAIDKATTNNDVATEQTKGTKAIDEVKVPSLTDSQTAAKQAIDDALNTKKSEINGATNLDQTTKDNLIKEATAAATTAKDAIDKATTNNDVATEQTKGTKAIDEVKVPSLTDSQTAAKQAIDDALNTKKSEINGATNLDQTTKDNLIKEATAAATTAKDAIDKATTNNDVATEQTKGTKAIDEVKVPSLTDSQTAAKQAIDDALNTKKSEINGATNLDQTTKDNLIKEATAAATTAKDAIDKATTNNDVATEQTKGTKAIDEVKVPSLTDSQTAAKQAIDDALNTKKSEINGATNLDQTTKDNLIKEATAAATTAKDAIDKATTNNDVATEQTKGTKAIDEVKVPSLTDSQTAAKQAIDDALNTKKSEINGATNLDQTTKDNLIKEATAAATTAKDAIDKATTNNDVATEQTKGTKAIDEVKVPSLTDSQTAAKQAIDDALNTKKSEINGATNLDQTTKDNLIKEATAAATTAKDAIDKATTNNDVATEQTKGTKAIDEVKVPSLTDSQTAAKQAIDDALNTKKSEINGATNLDQTTKDNLIKEATAAATTAKDAIDKATTNNDVATEQTKGTKAIDEVKVPSLTDSQTAAKQAIDDALNTKKSEINGATNLDQTTKDNLIKEATAAATTAKDAIDKATTNNDVATEQTKGTKAIDEVKVPSLTDSQTAAKQAIDDALNTKKSEINGATNLDQTTKDNLIKEATAAATTAKDAIDKATTNNDVATEQTKGTKAIDEVKVPSLTDSQTAAKQAIDDALNTKKSEINGATNLDQTTKDNLIKEATAAATTAKDAIDKATTNNDVATEQTKGTKAIDEVKVPSLTDSQTAAKQAIDDALNTKKSEINGATNLDQTTKDNLIKEATAAATTAKDAIDKATTNNDVATEQTKGTKAIDEVKVPSLTDSQTAAKQAIDDALNTKKSEINGATNLDQTTKDNLIKEATAAATTAKDAIDKATTNNDVATEQTKGTKAIDEVKVPSLTDSQTAAKQAIDDALNTKKSEINGATNLDQTTKDNLIKEATAAATTAKDAIDKATTNNDVATEQTKGTKAIDEVKVPSLTDSQTAAKQAIDDALNTKKSEINGATNLDQTTKDNLIKEATAAATTAKDAIDKATTNNDVATEQTKGTKAIDEVKVPSLTDSQTAAKQAIDDALNTKKSEINGATNLDQTTKDNLIKEATAAATTAKDAIDKATTNNDVATEQTKGTKAIDEVKVPSLTDSQTAAKQAIDDALNTKKSEINGATNLDQTTKDNLIKEATAAATTAKDAIDKATTNNDVATEQTKGTKAIDEVKVPSLTDSQTAAKQAIDDALNTKKSEINGATNLDQTTKDNLIKEATAAATTAKDAIDKATTNNDVATEQTKGTKAIDEVKVPSLTDSQTAAKQAIDDALNTKKSEINGATNLDQTTKDNLIKEATAAATTAKDAIDKATTNNDVATEQTKGTKAIDEVKVPSLTDSQTAAKQAIDDALNTKKSEINGATNLDQTTKDNLIKEATAAATTAKDAIDKATTNNDVATEQTKGTKAIDEVKVPSLTDSQTAAKQAIDDALNTKKSEINGATNLDQTTKDNLIKEATAAATTAKDAIDKATTNNDVATEQTKGTKAIDEVKVPSLTDSQTAAKQAIDDALNTKKSEINGATNLDQTTKDNLIKEATAAATTAKDAIDKATTNNDVATEQTKGTKAIDEVKVPSLTDSQTAAKQAIDDALNTKKSEINGATNLDQTTKDNLIKEATAAATTAKDAIDKATTNNDVATEQTKGTKAIDEVKVPSLTDSQTAAKQAIDDALNTKKSEINGATNLDQTTKDNLIKEATAAATTAKDAIDKATTNNDVATEQTKGTKAIDEVKVPSLTDSQTAAKQAIDDALNTKKSEINGATNLDQTTKDNLIKEATAAATTAKDAIDKATTNNDVATEQTKGTKAIDEVKVPSLTDSQTAAKQAIDDALNTKKSEINGATNLDQTTKDNLIKEATAAATTAKDAIDKATTNNDVATEQTKGTKAIDEVKVPSLTDSQTAAKQAIDQAAKTKDDAIDASNLTAEEKADLKKTVAGEVQTAKDNIDDATKDADVTTAQTNGEKAINAVEIPTTSATKADAINAINTALADKKTAINGTNLTAEEKSTLVNQAQQLADDAIANINKATTNDAVKTAKDTGVETINNINVPTTSATKDDAINAINTALADKKTAINGTNLTAEEKSTLVNQAQQLADDAIANINKATTNDAVKTAKNTGVGKINNINVPATSATKDAAKDAIDQAVKTKDDAIDASNLTAEEKDALKKTVAGEVQTAKGNIDAAPKDADVTTAKNTGVEKINNMNVTSATKDAAKDAIDQAAKTKNDAIDASNLTDEEKDALKKTVAGEVKIAKDNIDAAAKDADVTTAKNTSVGKIKNINVTSATKADAKAAIDQAAKAKNDAIDASNLTAEEKDALKKTVAGEVKTAKDNIDAATKDADVKTAQTAGEQAINNINVPAASATKTAAKNAIDQAAKAKNDAIDASNLTAEEKDALKQKVAGEVKIAKDNIDAATKDADVTTAKNTGVEKINNINVPTTSATKDAAKDAIDQAAKTKNDAIDASNLTAEEKDALKKTVAGEVKIAKDNIDAATKDADVTTAKNTGVEKINNMNVTSATKDAAKAAIDQAAKTKNDAIDASNLTAEEKDTLKQTVAGEVNKAKDAIDAATKDADVKTAQTAGEQAINNIKVPATSATKDDANKAIDDALAKKIDEINKSNLTDEEKAKLTTDANADANNAKANIQAAKTNDAVNTAKENGVDTINNVKVPDTSATKDDANKAIDAALDNKKSEINNATNIDQATKDNLIQAATDAANKAKEAINQATTNNDVATEQTKGTNAIDAVKVPSLTDSQSAAKDVVDTAVAKQKELINNSNNLSDSEKQDLNQQVDAATKTAKDAIDAATTNDGATKAGQDGVAAIEKVVPTSLEDAKRAANQLVDEAVSKKLDEIKANTNLTDEEKAKLTNDANTAANNAKANIQAAKTNDAVKTAKENGVEKINNVNVPATSATKDDAKNAIDQAAKAKNDAIDASNLTAEEKDALKKTVAGEVQTAKDNIDAATKDADVKTAQTSGEQAINAVEIPASVSKTDAINAINTALSAKKGAINGTNLTAEEQSALVNQAQKLADDAIANINKATTNDAVNTAKENGVQAIKNMTIPTVSDVKQKASANIDDVAKAAKQAIDNTNGLTDSEKQAAKSQVDTDAKAAKEAIDKADSNDAVTNAVNNGTVAINKDAANAAIDGALVEKNKSIDTAPNLTDEEKQSVKDQANKAADSAKTAISNASTVTAVESAKNTGVDNINKVSIPAQSKAKAAAIAEIYAELNKKLDAINNNLVLVTEEKDALTNEAKTAADKAKDAINKAASNADVESEEDKGITNIQNVDNPAKSQVKEADKAAVQAVADSKINAIDNAPNLTAEEKAELVKQVNDIASNAKVNIDNSSSSQSVETVRDNGISAIKAVEITTSSKTKKDANSDLDNTADAAKKAIDKTSGLTDDQKQTAKDQIDKAVDAAKENIKKASDNTGVADATDAGKLAIDKVSAKAAIDAAVAAKKSKIAKASLTAEEAKPLNDLVDQEADAAKDAIDAATTNAVVEAAKNNGVETINNINVPATFATKDDANKAIADALAKKIEEINNANLTDDQKQSLIDQAQNAANQAKENVRSASTDEDVQTAKNNGIAAINGITVKSNSVDDQDNSATNEGNGNQAGHIQSDNSSDVTKHSSTQQSGNEKDKLPQTGNEIQRGAGLVGLAIAGLAILLGSAGFRKKRD